MKKKWLFEKGRNKWCNFDLKLKNMKAIKSLVLIFSIVVFNSCQDATGNENVMANESVEMSVEGMVCAVGCAKHIEKEMAGLPGITNSEVDFEKGVAVFKFDNKKLSVYDIENKIEKMNEGQYKVEILETEKIEDLESSTSKSDKNVSTARPDFKFPNLFTYFMNNL